MGATIQDSVLIVRQRFAMPPIPLTSEDRTRAELSTRFERIHNQITIDRRVSGQKTIEDLLATAERSIL